MNRVELVAPAGDLEKLQFALHYGADAVYLGGENFSLRQRAGNFTLDQMSLAREITREYGAKMYVAVNIFARNYDLGSLASYLTSLSRLKVDGLIISDPGIFLYAREYAPELPITISTQANTCNWKAVQFWQELGARRICLARELTLREIQDIRQKTSLELEVFVHGSMCVAYSGRCLLSNYFLHRDSNRGDCAQPCRWRYHLVEEHRLDDPLLIEEDRSGTYLLSSKDLCMIEYLPLLIAAGVNSLKIEGRMRSLAYVSIVTKVYREAIDAYLKSPHTFQVQEEWLQELGHAAGREYTTGFYFDSHPRHSQAYQVSKSSPLYQIAGLVYEKSEGNRAAIKVCHQIGCGDMVEIFRNTPSLTKARVVALWNQEDEPAEILHPGAIGFLEADKPLYKFDLIRKKVAESLA